MSQRAWFWNILAGNYFRQAIDDPAAYETKLEMTRKLLHPNMRLLEFGCGTGGTALKHAPLVEHVTGIDVASRMIGFADQQKAEQGISNADFHVASIQNFPAPEAAYDMILGLSIIHLLPNRATVFAKVHRQLKPGGYFISSTTCLGSLPRAVRWLLQIGTRLGVLPILRTFTSDQLIQEIEGAGFKIREVFHPAPDKAIFLIAEKI